MSFAVDKTNPLSAGSYPLLIFHRVTYIITNETKTHHDLI